MTKDVGIIVDFLFEVGLLAETPRSGFNFLGSGKQSVAEHTCRDVFIGYALAQMEGKSVDAEKVIKMCLFHDLAEARTSDLNYVHQKYTRTDEKKAIRDATSSLPFGNDIKVLLDEYQECKTKEAKLAKDADNIEWILSLKEQADTGNKRAKTWIPSAMKRLRSKPAKQLAARIIKINSDNWWFSNKDDEWWVDRKKKT